MSTRRHLAQQRLAVVVPEEVPQDIAAATVVAERIERNTLRRRSAVQRGEPSQTATQDIRQASIVIGYESLVPVRYEQILARFASANCCNCRQNGRPDADLVSTAFTDAELAHSLCQRMSIAIKAVYPLA